MVRIIWLSVLMCACAAHADLKISDSQVRAMPPGQPNTAAFLTLKNTGQNTVVLTSVRTDVAQQAQYHNHVKSESGVMSMQQVSRIAIKAGQGFVFKSGAHHIMLMGLKRQLKPGENVDITLEDEQGNHYTYQIPVVSMFEQSDMHHHHHHGKE